MVADPKLTPVTCGTAVGVVAPSKNRMFGGLTDTMEESLLASATYMTLGAGLVRVTASEVDCPGPTDTPGDMTMSAPNVAVVPTSQRTAVVIGMNRMITSIAGATGDAAYPLLLHSQADYEPKCSLGCIVSLIGIPFNSQLGIVQRVSP